MKQKQHLSYVWLNMVKICLVTRSVIVRVSKPIADCSCIDSVPLVHPYRPAGVSRIAQSVKRVVFVWRLATYLFLRGSNCAGGMLAKNIEWLKTSINENPCGMYEWFDCPCRVAVVSQSISRADENYPSFPPPQDSRAKCIFRSRIAWFDAMFKGL